MIFKTLKIVLVGFLLYTTNVVYSNFSKETKSKIHKNTKETFQKTAKNVKLYAFGESFGQRMIRKTKETTGFVGSNLKKGSSDFLASILRGIGYLFIPTCIIIVIIFKRK